MIPSTGTSAATPMKVSIITPVHNEPRVKRALDSIYRQRHSHEIETIVIDAKSTDETLALLQSYKNRIDILVSECDRGLYDGMNKGVGYATGEVVGILNADDCYADEDVLRDVINIFLKNPEIDVCYGDMIFLDDNARVTRYWRPGPHRRFKWYLGWRPPHPSFFVRKRIYQLYGCFNLDFPIASDYEFQLRLLLKNEIRYMYLDRTLVYMAPGGTSNGSIRNIIKANVEAGRAWKHNQLPGGIFVPMLKPLRQIRQFFRSPPSEALRGSRYWIS